MNTTAPQNSSVTSTCAHSSEVLHGCRLMAASTASSSPLTAFLHRHDARSQRRARFVVAASTADAEPSPEATAAAASSTAGPGKKKTVDTRIHWSDPDEGWVGGKAKKEGDGRKDEPMGRRFADLINNPSESHYQFLGIAPGADLEEIKAAYRRLSKEYHPDTTRLPLKTASEKFIRLREVYKVLSKEESRRFYDWTLAQEAESRRLQQLRSRLEDPYELDLQNYEPVPDTVDRLGGKNMELSDQAMTALAFDIGIIIFSICCIIYALFFKEQY
ncbi:NAD(P)H-quinone oxidoreductase subunit T, chloroplastic [Triticum aestivum]|nr:NAD(P)H-quinone oxidoreductase subunit T, chloroplastic [Aegilops tauschii subsp. strangulata]XP_044374001.1 NAD(P)H-quinone oxidoreductase subunit T, chloroplastic-like [Triticum aestivum]